MKEFLIYNEVAYIGFCNIFNKQTDFKFNNIFKYSLDNSLAGFYICVPVYL